MNERVPVFDRWGNLVGYFTRDTGCGPYGWIVVLLLIVPLISIFYLVNVFRIGKHLLHKGENLKSVLWFGMWLFPYLIGLFINSGEALPQFLPTEGPLSTILALLIVPLICSVPVVFFTQLFLVFKYSDLNF